MRITPDRGGAISVSAVGARVVVVGAGSGRRSRALVRSLIGRGREAVAKTGPPERLVEFAVESGAVAVVLEGPLPGPALRAISTAVGCRADIGVIVVGPLEPDVEALIAVASGASGYLPTTSGPSDIADAVEAVLRGEPALPIEVSVPLVQHLRTGGRGVTVGWLGGRSVELTGREWEVLVLLRQAYTTAEMAERLVIARVTVRSHVAALVHKLGAGDRAALATPLGGPSTWKTTNTPHRSRRKVPDLRLAPGSTTDRRPDRVRAASDGADTGSREEPAGPVRRPVRPLGRDGADGRGQLA